MSPLRASLLGLLCGSVLAGTQVLADTNEVDTDQPSSVPPEISLWVKEAPLSLVVQQLAQLSGREAAIEGELGEPVSGRFVGTMDETLAALSTSFPVLFDLDETVLRAVDGNDGSSISIAVVSEELTEEFKAALFEQLSTPGNDIEIRADAIRVSGHPAFVKRATGMITRTLADNGARQIVDLASGTDATEADIDTAATDIASGTDDAAQAAGAAVIDAGSDEMLADMADEDKPPADQATLSKPIRWVTDIPGFDTF